MIWRAGGKSTRPARMDSVLLSYNLTNYCRSNTESMQYSHYRLRKCLTDVFFQKQDINSRDKKNDDSMISDFMILIFGLYDI